MTAANAAFDPPCSIRRRSELAVRRPDSERHEGAQNWLQEGADDAVATGGPRSVKMKAAAARRRQSGDAVTPGEQRRARERVEGTRMRDSGRSAPALQLGGEGVLVDLRRVFVVEPPSRVQVLLTLPK